LSIRKSTVIDCNKSLYLSISAYFYKLNSLLSAIHLKRSYLTEYRYIGNEQIIHCITAYHGMWNRRCFVVNKVSFCHKIVFDCTFVAFLITHMLRSSKLNLFPMGKHGKRKNINLFLFFRSSVMMYPHQGSFQKGYVYCKK
jgi:hypothetical protein